MFCPIPASPPSSLTARCLQPCPKGLPCAISQLVPVTGCTSTRISQASSKSKRYHLESDHRHCHWIEAAHAQRHHPQLVATEVPISTLCRTQVPRLPFEYLVPPRTMTSARTTTSLTPHTVRLTRYQWLYQTPARPLRRHCRHRVTLAHSRKARIQAGDMAIAGNMA